MSFFDNDPTPVSDLEAAPTRVDPSVVDGDDNDDDETMVSFPAVDQGPRRGAPNPPPVPVPGSQPRLPSIRPPQVGTGPASTLDEAQLFGDLSEELPLPPLMAIKPRRRVVGAQLKSSARAVTPPIVDLLPIIVAFLAGVAVTAATVIVVSHIRSGREPASETRRARSAPPTPQKRAKPVQRAAEKKKKSPPPSAGQKPAPAEPQPREPTRERPTDPPAVRAGKQLARAVLPCKLRHGGQSLRIAAYLSPPGEVRRVFMARRAWLNRAARRCVRRRLVGTELEGFTEKGYAEWHLWLGPGPVDAELVRLRRRD